MKKQLLNLGKALTKAEQKSILGGWDEEVLLGQSCFLRCNQDSSEGVTVSDCSRSTAVAICGNISNAVCVCS